MPVACSAGMVIAGRQDTLCPAPRSSPLPGECPCAALAELPRRPFFFILGETVWYPISVYFLWSNYQKGKVSSKISRPGVLWPANMLDEVLQGFAQHLPIVGHVCADSIFLRLLTKFISFKTNTALVSISTPWALAIALKCF